MPFFSIIIPLYNKEHFVSKTLEGVLNQLFTDYEVIVVNDGSTDQSVAKVEQVNDKRITILHQQNQGVSAARNKGIETANAKFICFLDADDVWQANHLQSFYEAIITFPDAKMYCNRYVTLLAKNVKVKNTFIDIADDYEGYVTDFFKSSLINRMALTSAVCIKKEVYQEIGGFNPTISSGQDTDYWIRIAIIYRVVITKNTTLIYNYLAANNSLSKTPINQKKLSTFEQFAAEELKNDSLKKFIDAHRIFYAMHFHILGYKKEKRKWLAGVNKKHLRFKTLCLLALPSFVSRGLLKMKHLIKTYGFDVNVYR